MTAELLMQSICQTIELSFKKLIAELTRGMLFFAVGAAGAAAAAVVVLFSFAVSRYFGCCCSLNVKV